MPFCSNCGEELKGARKYCNKCGYKIQDDEYELLKQSSTLKVTETEEANRKEEEQKDAEVVEKPTEKIVIPPGAKVKSKIPKSTTCLICGEKTDDICFFCDYAVCKDHSVKMQVLADKSKIGNIIFSCSKCATKKEGRQPTKDEAAEIGFFFTIKPYHEWKVLD